MFKLVALFFLTFSMNSFAFLDGCAKDIFKVGASFDSAIFNADRDGDELDLVSDEGLGIKLHWIIYCPDSGVEVSPYIYSRNYSFKSNSDFPDPPEDIDSFTLGVDISKRMTLFGATFDGILGIATREDLIVTGTSEIHSKDYDNFLILVGFQKGLYTIKDAKGQVRLVAGMLFSQDDEVKDGYTFRASTDLLIRLSKKYSLVLDLFYDFYKQEERYSGIDFTRQELGLTSSFLFRF